jgi:hypothetical protein
VEKIPTPRATLDEVGKRLSRSLAVSELSELGARGERLLAVLTVEERWALGHGLIRFRVDRPVIVEIAAPAGSALFWLRDQGFAETDLTLVNQDSRFVVYRKTFSAGWVGLGVNGLDTSPVAHYAVFVRPARAGEALAIHDLSPERLRLVPSAERVSAYVDLDRPFRALPPDFFGTTVIQTLGGERTSCVLLSGRAWKTHAPSGPLPDQVAIAFGGDAATSLSWTWRTSPEIRETFLRLAPCVDGRIEPESARHTLTLRGESEEIFCDGLLNDPTIRRHHVVAQGLKPETTYVYSAGDGRASGWTPWRTVRTGPVRSAGFGFLYMGDAQCGLEGWGQLLRMARAHHPDAAFLLMAGDLVDRGNERTNWDHFFLRARDVFDALPMMPAAGNHEYLDGGPRLFRGFFELPQNGPPGIASDLVYAFEYGDAFFAILDSELALSDPGAARVQAAWLDARLANTPASWKFVMFHHPVYASHESRQQPALREAWVPVFDKHHVDIVFQGHDHAYLRTYPLRGGQRVQSARDGTTYVVSVSGNKFYGQNHRPYAETRLANTSTYQTIDIRSGRLSYRAFDATSREVDGFEIEKSVATARRISKEKLTYQAPLVR